ncbi:autotransporter outer membrane beta-barrel domain-containing protein [Variovorax sp. dw_308]|uniref:autotransporter outer membrane beta-barrel domain-containing protein n=1 Tax=Variovorax sp. dw_308 TaxID=2721546 RepID=UPI001C48DCD1|nr:autotransporter outer membrane beta-barrel domain-containing protein [Variovorax sp. dw_308]
MRKLVAALAQSAVLLPAGGAAVYLSSTAALADSGPACQKGSPTACQIVYTEAAAGHGDTGSSTPTIISTFTNSQTLTAVPGPTGWGAVQFESHAGNGGDANSDGQDGGAGGMGNTVSAVTGAGVTATGTNTGGILRFTAQGGDGGGGQGDHVGSPGRSGVGGGGGEVDVTMNGTVTSTDPGSPGLYALSQGGSSQQGDSGSTGFFGAKSGNGGGSNAMTVSIGGTITTAGTGASINAVGGNGGTGVEDSSGASETEGRDGGAGGPSVLPIQVTVTGRVQSSAADGVDVLVQGGNGGDGGKGGEAPSSSTGGNGGDGGFTPAATLTVSGRVGGGVIGALVQNRGGSGGNGGASSNSGTSSGGVGGNGATADTSTLILQSGGSIAGGTTGASAASGGGDGGTGGVGGFTNDTSMSGNGGAGGAGGAVVVDIGQTPQNQTPVKTTVSTAPGVAAIGVSAISYGGAGGAAAVDAAQNYAHGGMGGAGGLAGIASVTIEGNGLVTTLGHDTPTTSTTVLPGVLVRSNGGVGGAGGNTGAGMGSAAGDAGMGGAGNTATAIINGSVSTSGSYAYGVLAQSIGGAGNAGGDADSVFGAYGGASKNGGAGGNVYMSGQGGSVTTSGTGAAGMVAQSVGGGGGAGGNALTLGGGGAIGGNGGAGGNGLNVTAGLLATDGNSAALNNTIVTHGDSSTALIAQSIGGAGGNGGNSLVVGTVLPSISIGGDGKSGGIGGTVNVQNDGLITTSGQQSGGIAAQSVGGGGGNGGASVAINAGVQVSTSFALGGAGATGGTGGVVNLTSNNQVSTYGADAFGLKAQSISGGGGQGGTALATAIALGGDPEFPTTSVSIGIGGSGGAGGDQSKSPVTVTNNGLITTAGDGAIGILAQNVAGGGGNGGDSTASSYANGGDKESTNVSVSSSVGGKGKGGGTGGAVRVNNNALVVTMGADAYGVFAQSTGGGGGVGGTGDSSASAGSGSNSFGGTVTVGGQGGEGGTGGTVTVNTNSLGNVATSGDGANAILAQSIGGGGGASGGGTAKANGGNLSVAVTVGGNAGSGGGGGQVNVTNQANLLTQGAEADAIFAQSVGGGGGKAGKGASTAGGAQKAQDVVNQMGNTIATGLGLNPSDVTKIADGVYKVGDDVWKGIDKLSDLQTVLNGGGASAALRDDDSGDGTSSNLKLHATIGGQGGIGGDGNQVTVNNSGSIQTNGTKSDGIFAQSIGGGGGVGGASSFSGSETSGGDDKDSTSGTLTVGGSGAGAGGGSTVQVTNTGLITTNGVTAYGINAQSVGGGGGKGGATAKSDGALKDFKVTIGGSGGAGGAGGDVTVTNDGAVTTNERQSPAILAQSTGGGGGTAHLLSSDIAATTSGNNMQISATLGGSGGAGGAGGNVTVDIGQNATGTVRGYGVGSIGVIAQSIGGGGGVLTTTSTVTDAQGGGNGGGIQDTTTIPITIGGTGGASGNGSTVNVTLGAGSTSPTSSILTTQAGAYGILAQSIGGGGGLFAGATPSQELDKLYGSTNQTGNGGSVNVKLDHSGWIYTSGDGAVGVIAQSVGGGGGVIGGMQNVNLASGLQTNPTAESGQGGNVSVDLESGGNIVTQGKGAHGIFAQAVGGGGGVVAGANNTGYAYAGATPYANCSGTGCTGDVSITMGYNTVVQTHGEGSYGIYAQSSGNGTNNTTITLNPDSWVESRDKSAGGIFIESAGSNTVSNQGNIAATASGTAISGAIGSTLVHNQSGGTIIGSINLGINGGTGSVINDAGGIMNLGTTTTAGSFTNSGTVNLGAAGTAMAASTVNGNFTSTGTISTPVDFTKGTAAQLNVQGNATLSGVYQLAPTLLANNAVTLVTSSNPLSIGNLSVHDSGNMLFTYKQQATSANEYAVAPVSQLATVAAANNFSAAQQSLAAKLNAGFTSSVSNAQASTYASLSQLATPAAYATALNGLSGEAMQAVGTARLAASHSFVERLNSCPGSEHLGELLQERDCVWARVIDNQTDRKTNSDSLGYNASAAGAQVGAQKRIGDGWIAGGSVSYDHSSLNADGSGGSVSGDNVAIGAIVKKEIGNWTISGAADLGRGSYDSSRLAMIGAVGGVATGSFDAWHAGLHSRIAYQMPYEGWYLKPYVDLHAVRITTGAYTETGAGPLALQVQKQSDTMFAASPMLEVGGRMRLDNQMELRAFAGIGAVVQNKSEWGAQANLAGWADGSTFRAVSSIPDQRMKVNLGANLSLTKSTELRLEYTGEFAHDYKSNTGSVKFNYFF